jgi:integrase/recombinase XerD
MSPLREALDDYLRLRRQLGFELKNEGRQLRGFVDFLEQAGAPRITSELAVAWATLPADAHPFTWRQRLGRVRQFARYVATIDTDTEVPAGDLLPARLQRVAPYIYTEAEITALMAAARGLTPPLRAATFETLIGLMASTGLRLGEALGLDRHDVDLKDGVLQIRAAKQHKQREVPIHATTTTALGDYARRRDRLLPNPDTHAFFLNTLGRRMHERTVHEFFPRLIREVGLEGCGQRARPRPHDLRHAFAVRTLLDWHRAGSEVERDLPLLSTFLGHTNPRDTYWYLQAVPELLELVGHRLDGALKGTP